MDPTSVSGTDGLNHQLAKSFRMGTTMVCFANVPAFVFVANTHGGVLWREATSCLPFASPTQGKRAMTGDLVLSHVPLPAGVSSDNHRVVLGRTAFAAGVKACKGAVSIAQSGPRSIGLSRIPATSFRRAMPYHPSQQYLAEGPRFSVRCLCCDCGFFANLTAQ